eukprot:COSAG01_NODE_43608_length_428_cov_0.647416_1_plen_42_part_10
MNNGLGPEGIAWTTQRSMPEDVSGTFPSWDRSILTEIYLCHA